MSSCSAATGIPIAMLKQAKRAGCPAFDQANRINAYGTYLLLEQEMLTGGKP